MIRNHHRVAACFAALVLFAAGSARAAAIDSVTYRGRGCPQGSVGTSIAGDGSAMTLIFDRFIASEAPNV